MKRNRKFILTVIGAALVCIFNAISGSAAETGKLTVMRSPTFGKKLVLDVYLDGKRVSQLEHGRSYTVSLSPGTHQVKVHASAEKPINTATGQVTIEAGKESTVTASWDGQRLVLR